jgi:hypothetical protein
MFILYYAVFGVILQVVDNASPYGLVGLPHASPKRINVIKKPFSNNVLLLYRRRRIILLPYSSLFIKY